jgi:divalent metal cation (Fe/Co/Zn/Cd) transporter
MLTPEEEKFLVYWSDKRNRVKSGFKQYRTGLSIGMVLGIGIIISLLSGWYSRANMVANSQSTPLVLLLGIVIISVFCSYFYKQFRREADEQRYKELMVKKEKALQEVQQDEEKKSHQK